MTILSKVKEASVEIVKELSMMRVLFDSKKIPKKTINRLHFFLFYDIIKLENKKKDGSKNDKKQRI